MSFITSRKINAQIEQVYAAISDPARLQKWWGPLGFTNTFQICEFKVGGRWIYTMRGPDGREYPNECVFSEIVALKKVVIEHVALPKYKLVIELSSVDVGTMIVWEQTFEKQEVAKAIAHIVEPANEQNLDRLTAEVFKK